jgi:large subunit ribosomal protein L19e
MTDVYAQKRIASEILKCGINRVWIDEAALSDVALAMTRLDVQKLIADGAIRKKQKKGISRGRTRFRLEQQAKNQRKGPGRRKGGKEARLGLGGSKQLWMNRIRAQRRYLRALREHKQLNPSDYRKYYRQAKGGMFRSVGYLRGQLQEAGFIKAPKATKSRRGGR